MHFQYVLYFNGKYTSGEFSQGSMNKENPDAANILDCLISDASCYEEIGDDVDQFIKDWSQYRESRYDYGWKDMNGSPVDDNKVKKEHARLRKTHAGCKKTPKALRRVFGEGMYELLMSGEIERL